LQLLPDQHSIISEYRKYQQKTLFPIEKAYLQSLKAAENQFRANAKNKRSLDFAVRRIL
jgi:hypothetical protein